uniref:Uncharacterized protein n=1 Tax=Arion vulgaris TaxID=1028688 RepID=A0A0B7AK05_9EUPU
MQRKPFHNKGPVGVYFGLDSRPVWRAESGDLTTTIFLADDEGTDDVDDDGTDEADDKES